MAIKLKQGNIYTTYFITFTCIDWLSLFAVAQSYDIVYAWFRILKKEQNVDIISYVIMPNHLHVILHFHKQNFNLNKIIANGKRFMAYKIIRRLEILEKAELSNTLKNLVTMREKKKGQLHKVFKDSFDAKAIYSSTFMAQKINYIHNNPVSGKWMLAKDFVSYEHSSASFYETQKIIHFTPLHYLDC